MIFVVFFPTLISYSLQMILEFLNTMPSLDSSVNVFLSILIMLCSKKKLLKFLYYLTSRTIFVNAFKLFESTATSVIIDFSPGVPQESHLGPVRFSLRINYFSGIASISNFLFCADDLK